MGNYGYGNGYDSGNFVNGNVGNPGNGNGNIYQIDGIDVLDDSNYRRYAKSVVGPDGCSASGYISRDFQVQPVGSIATEFPDELIIDPREWPDRIADKLRKKERTIDFVRNEMPHFWLNQDPTNSCWGFSIVQCCMIVLARMGQSSTRLCPYSVTGPINRYRDVGGYVPRALEQIRSEGIASCELWPMSTPGSPNTARENSNAINNGRKYYEGSRADAATRRNLEFFECSTWIKKGSALLRDMLVPDGYDYEGHSTGTIDLAIVNGEIAGIDMDSYTPDGKPHLRYRVGARRAMGSMAIAVRGMTAA